MTVFRGPPLDETALLSLPLPHRGSLEDYARGVSDLPLPAGEGEAQLLERARSGDRTAMRMLVAGQMRYVVDEALRLRGTGMPLRELIAAGNEALREAVTHYPLAAGAPFGTWARSWIRVHMRSHLEAG